MTLPEKNTLEWTVFGVSALLIAAIIGGLLYGEVSRPDGPPDLRVRTGPIRQTSFGFAVPVDVENRGGKAAANVEVEVAAGEGQDAPTGTLTLTFVPASAVRTGEVVFTTRPGATPTARIIGYALPD